MFYDEQGVRAGVYNMERKLDYHRFNGTGYRVSSDNLNAMFKYVEEVVWAGFEGSEHVQLGSLFDYGLI